MPQIKTLQLRSFQFAWPLLTSRTWKLLPSWHHTCSMTPSSRNTYCTVRHRQPPHSALVGAPKKSTRFLKHNIVFRAVALVAFFLNFFLSPRSQLTLTYYVKIIWPLNRYVVANYFSILVFSVSKNIIAFQPILYMFWSYFILIQYWELAY